MDEIHETLCGRETFIYLIFQLILKLLMFQHLSVGWRSTIRFYEHDMFSRVSSNK